MFVPSNNSKSSFLKSVFAQPDNKTMMMGKDPMGSNYGFVLVLPDGQEMPINGSMFEAEKKASETIKLNPAIDQIIIKDNSGNTKKIWTKELTLQEQASVGRQNIIKIAVELDVPTAPTGTAVLPSNIKNKINIELSKISSHDSSTYYQALPLNKVSEILKTHNLELLDEDNTPLKWVMLTGKDGKATFNLALNGKHVSNSMVVTSWHKMESGRYEFLVYLS